MLVNSCTLISLICTHFSPINAVRYRGPHFGCPRSDYLLNHSTENKFENSNILLRIGTQMHVYKLTKFASSLGCLFRYLRVRARVCVCVCFV